MRPERAAELERVIDGYVDRVERGDLLRLARAPPPRDDASIESLLPTPADVKRYWTARVVAVVLYLVVTSFVALHTPVGGALFLGLLFVLAWLDVAVLGKRSPAVLARLLRSGSLSAGAVCYLLHGTEHGQGGRVDRLSVDYAAASGRRHRVDVQGGIGLIGELENGQTVVVLHLEELPKVAAVLSASHGFVLGRSWAYPDHVAPDSS
jgi:hypothetical protein